MALTAVVVVLAIPGLVVEPGPLSEILALAAIGAVGGVEFPGVDDAGGGG